MQQYITFEIQGKLTFGVLAFFKLSEHGTEHGTEARATPSLPSRLQ